MPWQFWKDRRGPAEPPPPEPPEDEEILQAVRALQAGAGPEAFAPIYRRFLPPLTRFFSHQTALREEAEDLAQATLIRAYEKIHQYRFEARFKTWLRQIGENVWLNAVRDTQAVKRAARLEPLGPIGSAGWDPSSRIADDAPDPEQAALAEEQMRVLQQAVEALPPGMRQCTELRVYGDLQYQEISDVTGIGLNTVRSQLFEARKRLKPVLAKYFQGADF
ncbi:MAG TPA: sigma-70 family RNA polymerase sigma factor [Thermoanaerobaculia bacterium]|nr:sigma-70 family RNA polymerase sigma factor [Thermoanaerobaculia bacterium]